MINRMFKVEIFVFQEITVFAVCFDRGNEILSDNYNISLIDPE